MVVAVALALAIFIPLAFWLFDVCIKVLGGFKTDDIGADLCLFGVSFNGSTLLTSAMSSTWAGDSASEYLTQFLSALTAGSLVFSLVIYVFSMILISPSHRRFPWPFGWLRGKSWVVSLTVLLGFTTVAIEICVYVLLLQAGGRP